MGEKIVWDCFDKKKKERKFKNFNWNLWEGRRRGIVDDKEKEKLKEDC